MNRPAHALKSSAAADGIRHRLIDLGIARIRVGAQEGGRGHNHAGLAVAALRNIFLYPGFLAWVHTRRGQPFNSGKALPISGRERNLAGPNSRAAAMYGTRPAHTRAAAVFRSGGAEQVAKHPQERHIRRRIYGMPATVDSDRVHGPLDATTGKNVSRVQKISKLSGTGGASHKGNPGAPAQV